LIRPVSLKSPRLCIIVRSSQSRRRDVEHTGLNIEHHLQRFLEERDHRVQTGQVEVIFDELFCDLAEVFVPREGAEPADPRQR
jgi:hypothetical protein